MAGKCVMLEKKMHELELEVADVTRLPRDSTAAAAQMSFDDIKERIEFLEKLRAAEAECQQWQDSDELRSIDERLAQVKATFFDWNQSKKDCGFDIGIDDDTQSVCSDCTLSHGLQRASDMPTRDVEEMKAEAETETETETETEAEAEAGWRTWSESGKKCGVFGCGMIAGVMLMMLKLYLYEYLIPEEAFSIPPT